MLKDKIDLILVKLCGFSNSIMGTPYKECRN